MKFCKKKEGWKKFAVKAVLLILFILASCYYIVDRYRIGIDRQFTKCLPGYTVFLTDTKNKVLERGAVYSFKTVGLDPVYKNGTRMAKILRGLPGDKIVIDESLSVQVNGIEHGKGLYHTKTLEKPSSYFIGKTTIKDGEYWFMGLSEKSFDSRYWGTVKDEQIVGRVYPLF